MARQASSEQREANGNGRRASVAKVGRTLGPRRVGERESAAAGPVNRRSEAHTEDHGHLHQEIAERAYLLYEQSGFQDGNDMEHWLEAERQIMGVRGHAA
jgi:Protein of unknown function (DUF2934)